MRLPPVQFLGDISYSVYLWHWPLIILAPFALGGELNTDARIGILMLTLLVAWLSKRFVEDPLRAAPFLLRRRAAMDARRLRLRDRRRARRASRPPSARCKRRSAPAERASDGCCAARPACFGAASRDPAHRATTRACG